MPRCWLVFVAFIYLFGTNNYGGSANERSKRFLLFPKTTTTRVQLISGFGIPVDLNLESLTMGYVYKANYFLPENASHYIDIIGDPFEKQTVVPISGRRRRQSGQHENESILNGNYNSPSSDLYDDDDDDDDAVYAGENLRLEEPHKLSESRFTLYRGLEKMADAYGLPGHACLLRSICETAEVPFSYSNGILGELAHLIMTPSSTVDELSTVTDNEYLHAEQRGKSGVACDQIYQECSTSFLEQFSGIYDSLNVLN